MLKMKKNYYVVEMFYSRTNIQKSYIRTDMPINLNLLDTDDSIKSYLIEKDLLSESQIDHIIDIRKITMCEYVRKTNKDILKEIEDSKNRIRGHFENKSSTSNVFSMNDAYLITDSYGTKFYWEESNGDSLQCLLEGTYIPDYLFLSMRVPLDLDFVIDSKIDDNSYQISNVSIRDTSNNALQLNLMKKYFKSDKCYAKYHSIWDNGIDVSSDCIINMKTGYIEEISQNDYNGDDGELEVLEDEYITLQNSKEHLKVGQDDKNNYFVEDIIQLNNKNLNLVILYFSEDENSKIYCLTNYDKNLSELIIRANDFCLAYIIDDKKFNNYEKFLVLKRLLKDKGYFIQNVSSISGYEFK